MMFDRRIMLLFIAMLAPARTSNGEIETVWIWRGGGRRVMAAELCRVGGGLRDPTCSRRSISGSIS